MILFGKEADKENRLVGGKGLGLVKLLSYGFRVPDFFVITSDTDLQAASFEKDLMLAAERLSADAFAVRSSGTQEDGEAESFAGQYDTLLNVSRGALYQAVLSVAASAASQKAIEYAKGAHPDTQIAVIVQKQIQPKTAGVLFTSAPESRDEILIEETDGAGDALVGGAIIPRQKRVSKSAAGEMSGYERELFEAASFLERKEGKPMDVEWAYDGTLRFLQMRPITTIGDALPDLDQKRWKLYVHRDFCRLCHSVQVKATDGELQYKNYQVKIPIYEGILLNGREFYTDKNDELTARRWAEYDKDAFFKNFSAKIEKNVRKTIRRANALKKKNYSEKSDKALFAAFRRAIDGYIESYLPLMMRPDDYLMDKLRGQIGAKRANELERFLPALAKKTMYSSEKKCFLQAVCAASPKLYVEKYEWSNNPLSASSRTRGEEEFATRAKALTRGNAREKLLLIKKREKANRVAARSAIESLAVGAARGTIDDIVEFIFLRTYSTENSDRYFYYIRERILREIARRKGISIGVLMGLRYEEISGLEHGEVDFKEQKRRNRGELIFFSESGAKAYYGAETYSLLQRIIETDSFEKDGKYYGTIACPGEAVGRARIVHSFADVEKMQEGEILITSMTTPEISLAIDRAVGIITDEGGVTCHAAIVAREWGVPCLTGTTVATRVLHDGDQIKLDCVNGFFEIMQD